MAGHWVRLGSSSVLFAGLLLVVIGGLGFVAGIFFFPQQFVVLGGLAFLALIGLQFLVFRLLGLRSHADEPQAELPKDDAEDWRAWKD